MSLALIFSAGCNLPAPGSNAMATGPPGASTGSVTLLDYEGGLPGHESCEQKEQLYRCGHPYHGHRPAPEIPQSEYGDHSHPKDR
jgi:hypothetical protein